MIHATMSLKKQDFATVNKVSYWLFSHLDEIDEELLDNDDFCVGYDDPLVVCFVGSQLRLYDKSVQ